MALVTLATKSVGDKVTAAWANDIKSNTDFLANPPGCQVYRSAALNISNNTDTVLSFDAETYDTDSMHSTSVNTSRVTINTAGIYVVNYYVQAVSATYTKYEVQLRLNGATSLRTMDIAGLATTAPWARFTLTREFSATDYVEIVFNQTSGATRALATGNNVTGMSFHWLGTN